jgi:hypothetical protein
MKNKTKGKTLSSFQTILFILIAMIATKTARILSIAIIM